MNLYLLLFGAAAAALLPWAWRKTDGGARVAMAVYLGIYILTTVVGSVMIGVQGVSVLDDLAWDLETRILTDLGSPLYWGLLLAPMIIVPAVLLWPSKGRLTNWVAGAMTGKFTDQVDLFSFWVVLLLFGGYTLFRFIQTGVIGALGEFLGLEGDFQSIIVLRAQVMDQLGTFDCGVLYSLLPALTQCAMFQAVRKKKWSWRLTFAVSLGLTAFSCIAVVQKTLIIIFGLFLVIGLMELRVFRFRTLLVFALAAILLLAGAQGFVMGEWSMGDTANLLIFRLASSYPYYVNVYPREISHQGLSLPTMGPPIRDNLDVFDQMYPGMAEFIQGAVAAPAHMRAYAQAGVVYALAVLVAIGVILKLVAAVRRRVRGPLTFALHMQMLVVLYYLSQVTLRDTFISSYGIVWSLLGLGAILAVRALRRPPAPTAINASAGPGQSESP